MKAAVRAEGWAEAEKANAHRKRGAIEGENERY